MYGEGISREGSLVDIATEMDIIVKSGAWYSYNNERLGQGRENAKTFLRDHKQVADAIEKKIRDSSNLVAPTLSGAEEEEEEEDFELTGE